MEYIIHVSPRIQQKYELIPAQIIVKQDENYTFLSLLQSKYPNITQLKTLLNRRYNVSDDSVYDELSSEIYMNSKMTPVI